MTNNDMEFLDAVKANLPDAVVETFANAFGDITVKVVSLAFEGLDTEERDDKLYPLYRDPRIDRLIALTPEEAAAWSDEEDLEEPSWPDSLARAAQTPSTRFPTDLDTDLDRPAVVTFYSLRGGVGRSTALAYTGRELAARGAAVVLIDMDFEAPGLAALFGVEDEVPKGGGLPELLIALERGEEVDLTQHLIRLDSSDELYLLPAGRPGPEYARVLSLLTPESWYRSERNPLLLLIEGLKSLPISPATVLIDSRTGLSPLSAPLLFDVADLAVIGFYPHPQAAEGTKALTRALLASKSRRSKNEAPLTPEPRFLVSPVPSGSPEVIEQYRIRAYDWINDWMSEVNQLRSDEGAITAEEICHFVSYKESVAASDSIAATKDARSAYAGLADWIEALLPIDPALYEAPVEVEGVKDAVLSSLTFSTGTSETQERFADSFVPTETMQRALKLDVPLVLGRKGTGKTAVFRRLVETVDKAVVVTTPDALRGIAPHALTPEGFQSLDSEQRADWRLIWLGLIAISMWTSTDERNTEMVPVEFREALTPLAEAASELATVRAVRNLLGVPDAGLILSDWIARSNGSNEPVVLLFDGLDTGFGSTDEQRSRRRRAISSLLPLALERSDLGARIRFKILLREDIWRTLSFQNKSHYFGRTVTLEWHDQVDYLRTVVRQATLSDTFRTLVAASGIAVDRSMERWPASDVLSAWNVLVGERMKGGKTTFTRNWVWNRLADGNGDHSPRALLQLFFSARDWEIREEQESAYDRSVIRPRALSESLGRVSDESLAALEEEFAELKPMFEMLRTISRTPLDASDLIQVRELIDLAREVGLLEVYEGREDDARRYRVPDLFRLGLGMSRMGQV